MISGWQDNGGNLYYKNKWFHILGGDCMESAIDQKDNSIIYISMYNGKIQRSLTNGVDWAFITEDIIKTEQGAWVTPYMLDAVNPDIIYAGFYNVWKSPNKGNTWTKISNFSSTQSLQSIAVAPSNSKYIYAATFSNIYRTTDGGANWTNITAGLPSTAITYIAVSEKNPDKLWITMSGYVANSKVFMSTDGGKTWINYYIGLPNVPVNCIVYENGFTTDNLYAGTDIGVYYRDSKLKTWIPYMYSLPNVIVNKLEVHYSTKKLRAASYGRGIWEVDLYSSVGIDDIAGRKAFPLKIFPNPANNKINISLSGIQLPANGYQLPATGIRIYNSLGQRIFITDFRPQTSDLVLDISDYPDGIYYVAMLSGNNTYSGSFVKHKE
jgi:hypothetical protein